MAMKNKDIYKQIEENIGVNHLFAKKIIEEYQMILLENLAESQEAHLDKIDASISLRVIEPRVAPSPQGIPVFRDWTFVPSIKFSKRTKRIINQRLIEKFKETEEIYIEEENEKED